MEKGAWMAVPGAVLALASSELRCGDGVYEHEGRLIAYTTGLVVRSEGVLSVEGGAAGGGAVVCAGDVVTCVVCRVTPRSARCELRCCGSRPLARPLRASLAKENVQDANRDRVDMYKCFRPGDVLLARVLPLSSSHAYELTTAEPQLGKVLFDDDDGEERAKIARIASEDVMVKQ